MLILPIPDSANSEVEVTLGGESYVFKYSFNNVDSTYRLDIYYRNQALILGINLREGVPLLSKYTFSELDHGELFVSKVENTGRPPTRDNIGLDKPYELVYVSYEEMRG